MENPLELAAGKTGFGTPPETEEECRALVLHYVREDKIAQGYMGPITGAFKSLDVQGHNKTIKDAVVIGSLSVKGYNTGGRIFLAPGCSVQDTAGNSFYEVVQLATWREVIIAIIATAR